MNARSFFLKLTCFAVGTVGVYFVVFFALSSVSLGEVTLLDRLNIYSTRTKPGGHGQTLLRFREAESHSPLDILFVGSSHTYRGFDPRLFAEHKLAAFNLGTHSQTPLNTYYLLKRYLGTLRPQLVVVECYPSVLTIDGYECFQDLAINAPLSAELFEMALALKSPNAVKLLVDKYLHELRVPLTTYRQRPLKDEAYVPGGYCETFVARPREGGEAAEERLQPLDMQLDYLEEIIELNKAHHAETLVVVHPLPADVLAKTVNYRAVSADISARVGKNGVEFVDFNDRLKLDPYDDFKDTHHLNADGVKKFNAALLDYLFENVRYRNLLTGNRT